MATKSKSTREQERNRNRDEVLRLKRTMNPATGLPYTYAEIAALMHVTPMTPHRYVPKPMRDRCCPMCLRLLEVENEKAAV